MSHSIPERLPFTLACFFALSLQVEGQEPIRLRERLSAGAQFQISSRMDVNGSLTLPADRTPDKKAKQFTVNGEGNVDYSERILDGDAKGQVEQTIRRYQRFEMRRKIGENKQESSLRPEVRRLVLRKFKQAEVPFSPDGPLTWSEIDLIRTDVFTPALTGLLTERDVRTGDEWTATPASIAELTDMDEITEGKIVCKLQEVFTRDGGRFARVGLSGTVRGLNEDGPNRQQIDGYYFFDLQSQHLSYLYVSGTSWMLDKDGQALGKVEGRFMLTRRRVNEIPGLTVQDLRGLAVEPNPENTLLLFREPGLGLEFVYSRRWRVIRADARQVALEEPRGSGLLITLEPLNQTPTGQQFQGEVQAWLQKQSAKIQRTTPLRKGSDGTEHFSYEVEMEKQKVLLDYRIVRQTAGGAVMAGRLVLEEASALQTDVERIAKSMRLVPPK
jgi:hypothetical protein